MKAIFPSLIAADSHNLKATMDMLAFYCAGYHVDVMDGQFVPNKTGGAEWVNNVARMTEKKVWVHAMVNDPGVLIDDLVLQPKSIISIHIEIEHELNALLLKIKEKKWIASLAVNPKTDIENCLPFLNDGVSHVLIMSVEPGSSGQLFLDGTVEKIKRLVEHRTKYKLSFTIGIDGGINSTNIISLAKIGVDHFAVGSGIFGCSDPVAALKKLESLIAFDEGELVLY